VKREECDWSFCEKEIKRGVGLPYGLRSEPRKRLEWDSWHSKRNKKEGTYVTIDQT